MGDIELFLTEDGSYTLFNSEKKEHYHSVHGAVQESRHVFIQAGLLDIASVKERIKILEVGFGTGLNALLTLVENIRLNETRELKIDYVGLEPNPISAHLLAQLKYCDYLQSENLQEYFIRMHSDPGRKLVFTEVFTFTLITERLQDYFPSDFFDLIYFDAFSPKMEIGLWDISIFSKLYSVMNTGGVLVTYCSKGIVRRAMQECGFTTERLPGPPGKHEMLRARKI